MLKAIGVLLLASSVAAGCSAGSLGDLGGNKPTYDDYLTIQTGDSCSGARSKISGDWKLDSSSEFGAPGDMFYTKSEMWSVSGGFWSISVMCSNGTVDLVSQFGLD
jgi:hypothetical protein